MAGINQHVVQRDEAWVVKGEGNSRDTSHHATQAEAAEAARDIARRQGSEVLIHGRDGRDGRIREKDSYGNDPYPPKGYVVESTVTVNLGCEVSDGSSEALQSVP